MFSCHVYQENVYLLSPKRAPVAVHGSLLSDFIYKAVAVTKKLAQI